MDTIAHTGGVPILVPRRADNGHRDELWSLLRKHVWAEADVFEGHHTEGPFNRSAALNTAANLAGDWDLAVIADSDSFVPPGQLTGAIRTAREMGRMVIAHSRWVNVHKAETMQLLREGWLQHDDARTVYNHTVSSMLAIPRTVWDKVNGFDEHFVGWGREDNAFIRAIKILDRPPLRIDGTVYHLEHDRPAEDANRRRSPEFQANDRRWRIYAGTKNPDLMAELVADNRHA